MQDNIGRLPLHYALEQKSPIRTVETLLDAFPEAVTIRDSMGRHPLDIVCNKKAPLGVIYKLVRLNPSQLGAS